jgi:hypothetical protein
LDFSSFYLFGSFHQAPNYYVNFPFSCDYKCKVRMNDLIDSNRVNVAIYMINVVNFKRWIKLWWGRKISVLVNIGVPTWRVKSVDRSKGCGSMIERMLSIYNNFSSNSAPKTKKQQPQNCKQ